MGDLKYPLVSDFKKVSVPVLVNAEEQSASTAASVFARIQGCGTAMNTSNSACILPCSFMFVLPSIWFEC